jgi:hypothetical protein
VGVRAPYWRVTKYEYDEKNAFLLLGNHDISRLDVPANIDRQRFPMPFFLFPHACRGLGGSAIA